MYCSGPCTSGSISGVCSVHYAFVLWLLFQVRHLQKPSTAIGSVWSLAWMWWIFNRSALVCLWNETCYHLHCNWYSVELFDWEMWCGRSLCLFSWGETALELRQVWMRRAVLPEYRRMGLGVCKLGNQCCCCADFHKWLCVYGEGRRREMVLASSFLPREVSPWMLPLRDMLQARWIISLCVP